MPAQAAAISGRKTARKKLLSFRAVATPTSETSEVPGKEGATMEPTGHLAEPEAGSFRTADGREACLFTLADYPIDAICQICRGTIRARSFTLPFEHLERDAVHQDGRHGYPPGCRPAALPVPGMPAGSGFSAENPDPDPAGR
jgi:hypothetical protein